MLEIKSVWGSVGGILVIYKNTSASECLRVSHGFISTNTLSVLSTFRVFASYFKFPEITYITGIKKNKITLFQSSSVFDFFCL